MSLCLHGVSLREACQECWRMFGSANIRTLPKPQPGQRKVRPKYLSDAANDNRKGS